MCKKTTTLKQELRGFLQRSRMQIMHKVAQNDKGDVIVWFAVMEARN